MIFSVPVAAFIVVRFHTRYIRVSMQPKRRSSSEVSTKLLSLNLSPLSRPPETKMVIRIPQKRFLLTGLGSLKAVRSVEG